MFARSFRPTLNLTKTQSTRFASTSAPNGLESAQKALGGAAEKGSQVWKATVEKAGNSLGGQFYFQYFLLVMEEIERNLEKESEFSLFFFIFNYFVDD